MKYGLLRKLLTLPVTISLLFSTPAAVIADSLDGDSCKKDIKSFIEEDFGETFDIIISNLEAYGMQDYIDADFTVDDLSILEPVDFIEKNDLSPASASDGIYHFPVMIKGRVVLIYDVIETDSGYTSTLGADFSPLLDSVICNEEKYADFYQDDYSLYALTSNYVYTQKGNAVFVDTLEDSSLPIVSGRQDSSGDCYNFECNIEYTEAAKNSVQNHSERIEEQPSDSNASDVSGIYDKLVQPCSIKPNIVPLSYYDRVDRRYIKEADPLNNAYALEGVCIEVTDIRPNGCSVTIKNSSEYQLGYSDGYHLEKYYGSNIWGRCEFWDNRIHSINDILHTFGSDSEKALKYDWTCIYGYLPSGRYRIRMDISTVSPQRIPKRANYFEVCAEFIID